MEDYTAVNPTKHATYVPYTTASIKNCFNTHIVHFFERPQSFLKEVVHIKVLHAQVFIYLFIFMAYTHKQQHMHAYRYEK